MTQNIYDDETFFAGYSKLPRSIDGLAAAPEWPSLQALLPDLRGARIVDLGCGFGWFCRWAAAQGAVEVQGCDISEKMLARAHTTTDDAAITYRRADLEQLELPRESCDLIYSSLVLHYIADLGRLLTQVAQALVPGGTLVFSVEHPIVTAPAVPDWATDAAGRKIWPVATYLDEGPRPTDWLAANVIKQHRTLTTYLNTLIRLGFILTHVEEWAPSEAQAAANPQWLDERQRPPFLLVAARKP
jgi:2-polyprenyl-3-methyl-5-hydroxy-6-metoxy-1,4-benzoquinol methylase